MRPPPLRLLVAILLSCVAPAAAHAADPAPPARLYAVTFTTGPAWDAAKPFQDQKHSREHSANLARMRLEGLVVLGGRYGDKGLILVRAASEATVRAEIAKDPSVAAGVFNASIEEYRPFLHGDTKPPATSPEIAAVRAVVAAFNAHQPDALAALVADDAKLIGISADGQSIDADGREAIRTWLVGYFKSVPDVRSEILDLTQTGPHVSFRERSSWTARDGTRRAQTSLAVYEVRDGKIARCWYFPSTRETPPPGQKGK